MRLYVGDPVHPWWWGPHADGIGESSWFLLGSIGGLIGMTLESQWDLRLLGGWQLLYAGHPLKVDLRQQRLLAALALHGRQVRTSLAGLLWPDTPEPHAAGSLRESIFLVNRQMPNLLELGRDSIALSGIVRVDVHETRTRADRLDDAAGLSLQRTLLEDLLDADLLPGWYENWVLAEQERWQCLRLSLLESLAKMFLAEGEIVGAMGAACAVLAVEPLRESAQRLQMQCYLAEGNNVEALRAYQSFSLRLRQEFGVSPSPIVSDLLEPLRTGRRASAP